VWSYGVLRVRGYAQKP